MWNNIQPSSAPQNKFSDFREKLIAFGARSSKPFDFFRYLLHIKLFFDFNLLTVYWFFPNNFLCLTVFYSAIATAGPPWTQHFLNLFVISYRFWDKGNLILMCFNCTPYSVQYYKFATAKSIFAQNFFWSFNFVR